MYMYMLILVMCKRILWNKLNKTPKKQQQQQKNVYYLLEKQHLFILVIQRLTYQSAMPLEIGLDISYESFPKEKFPIKCQALFLGSIF